MVFEKKLQDEDTWKLYKRAYKKYYARYMKGNMSEAEFKAWGEQAAADRDSAIEQLKATADAALSASIIQQLKEKYGVKILLSAGAGPDISSTMVREALGRGERVDALVPARVLQFMEAEHVFEGA